MNSPQPSDIHREAVEALVQEHWPYLVGLARQYVKSQEDAEDIVQAALLRVLQRAPTLPSVSIGYLMRSVQWGALTWRRHQSMVRRVSAELNEDPVMTCAGVAPSTSVVAQRARARRVLAGALASLSRTEREAVELVRLQGMSLEQAAVTTGIALGTLKQRLWRARRSMREHLARHGLKSLDDV